MKLVLKLFQMNKEKEKTTRDFVLSVNSDNGSTFLS